MSDLYLPIRETGLTLEDVGVRLYRDGVALSGAEVASLMLVQVEADGGYRLSGLPTPGAASWAQVTFEYPAGVGQGDIWQRGLGSPSALVIPIRASGLASDAFDLRLFANGVRQAVDLTVVESPGGGDYVVSGWPTGVLGEQWELAWTYGGISGAVGWRGTVQPAAGGQLEQRALRSALRIGKRCGETIQVLEPHSLFATLEGKPPAVLELSSAAVAGDSALTLRSTHVKGVRTGEPQPLKGSVESGNRLTIDGNVYQVSETASVVEDDLAVEVEPALASALPEGTEVELGPGVDRALEGCRFSAVDLSLVDDELILEGDQVVKIPKLGAPVAPTVGMFVSREAGRDGEIVRISRDEPGYWEVHVGSPRSRR
ncbi:MAG: hypothetical protein AAF604_04560 [Acidobacteriota bacterium]